MKFTVGLFSPHATVEVTNRQSCVEFKLIDGFASEEEVRAAVGNIHRDMYANHYDGYYFNRKPAIDRIERDIKETREKLEKLEFALKVTKKQNWVKVENEQIQSNNALPNG